MRQGTIVPHKAQFIIFALFLPLCGQELRMSLPEIPRGKAGSVSIRLASPAGKKPAALQWDLFFIPRQISIQDNDWALGDAANAAGKKLTCVRQLRKNPETYSYRCLVAGGEKPIGDGVVAVLKISVPQGAAGGQAELRLENALGASREAGSLRIEPTRGDVKIR